MDKRTKVALTAIVAIAAGLLWIHPTSPRSTVVGYLGLVGLLVSGMAVARLLYLTWGASEEGQRWSWTIALLSFASILGGTNFVPDPIKYFFLILWPVFLGCIFYKSANTFSNRKDEKRIAPTRLATLAMAGSFVVVLVVVASVMFDWHRGRMSAETISTTKLSDFQRIELCRQRRCRDVDQALWPPLLSKIGQLQPIEAAGSRADSTETHYVLRFHSLTSGEFSIRIWERHASTQWIAASVQRPHRGGTSFYGTYRGAALKAWLDEMQVQETL